MLCPMKFSTRKEFAVAHLVLDCEKEKCAWWDEEKDRCAIKAISLLNDNFITLAQSLTGD